MAATHYLYYFNDDGQLSRVDWPPDTSGLTTVWNNYVHGTATFDTTVPGDAGGDSPANVVLGSAGDGASIWIGGRGGPVVQAVWRIDATDLTTVLEGPIYHIVAGAATHAFISDTNWPVSITGVDEKSRAFVGWIYDDSNNPGDPTCNYVDAQSGHRLISTPDAFTTVYDSGNKVDSNWDAGSPCPDPRKFHAQNNCWDRQQGVWTTSDGHKLYVWVIPYEDGDFANGDAAYDLEAVHYDIYARLDAATTDTVTRIVRSPGLTDAAIFNAGYLNNSIGFDPSTNLMYCYMLMDIPVGGTGVNPYRLGRIYVASFTRAGATFTLASSWATTPCSRIDCISPDGSQVLGSLGDLLGESVGFTPYISVDHGVSWTTINTMVPGISEQSLSRVFSVDSSWPQPAPARIIPLVVESQDRIGMLVNWENDDDWLSHAVDDVTANIVGVKIVQVAADPRIEVDTMLVTLKDPTGQYVPARTESSLYGLVRLDREVRWNVERHGVKVCRFHGKVKEYAPALPHKTDVDRVQKCVIRVESPLRELADAKITLVTPPSGVLVAGDGSGVIAQLLSLVPDIIPAETWRLGPTDVTPEAGFLTSGMSLQTALEQCAILADAVYGILPHYRDVPSPKFYFIWIPRTTSHATVDHTWIDTAEDISYLTPRFTGDDL